MKRLVLSILVAVFHFLLFAQPAAATEMIELAIAGGPGQMYAGDCYLVTRLCVQKRHRVEGEVPTRIWLPAEAVRCNLQKSSTKGKMSVSVIRDGVVEVIQESRYPLRWIVISSSGPWGKASGGAFAARPSLQ